MSSETNVKMVLRPHPLAFSGLYILWAYIAGVSLFYILGKDMIVSGASGIPLIGSLVAGAAHLILWGILILVPLTIVAVVKIAWKYFLLGLLIGVVAPALMAYFGWPTYPWLGAVGLATSVLGAVFTELHRRAHVYYITDRGIVMEYRGLTKTVRREVLYSQITDIVLEKGLLGKLFGFGNVIPITGSGLGLGADTANVGVAVGGGKGVKGGVIVMGGRGVNVPRSRTFLMLYGVPKPEEAYNAIVEAMREAEEAPYLKKILKAIEEKGSV